jgi:hypothetical protein
VSELDLLAETRRGDQGAAVKRVQEWLCLQDFGVKIDSSFGAATEAAVKAFQDSEGITVDGIVGSQTWSRLVAPMQAALAPIPAQGRGLGAMVVAYATQHLQQAAREVGGDNCGPWVRLYMDGHEGRQWRWCAGFACFCVRQACDALDVNVPITTSFSCDLLVARNEHSGLFLDGDAADIARRVTPGCLFVVRHDSGDWTHTGIVSRVDLESFGTIEGNSNDEGSPNGYEVVARTRAFIERDFIRIA